MLIEMREAVSGLWQDTCEFAGEAKNKVAGVVTGMALTAGSAYAAVPADVTTAIGTMKDDALAVATAFLVATIVIIAFLFMRKGARG
jgi:hypothetical protein